MKKNIQIICVVNKIEVFNTTIKNNPYMSAYDINMYDNTAENIGIPFRYNDFIDNKVNDNAWLIFCHQDFGFREDPYERIKDLDKGCIYGPVGAARKRGIYIRKSQIRFARKVILGQINQSNNDSEFYKNGIFLQKPAKVETIDCCCIIVHSSLIHKFHLRFDEKLRFHLYAEDFSLHAKNRHGINTMAIQIDCEHSSLGHAGNEFYESLEYVRSKYKGSSFVGTCF